MAVRLIRHVHDFGQHAPLPAQIGSRAPFLAAILLAFGATLSVLAGVATTSLAQDARPVLDKPYGPVLTMAQVGNTLYMGGEFDHVGPLTGNAVALSSTTGRLVGDPGLHGYGLTSIPDGAGGCFMAGDFRSASESYVRHLAHIRADGSLGPLNPNTNGGIYALVRSRSTLYVGGDFTTIDGYSRIRVAAIDVTTGTVTPWDAHIGQSTSNTVAALAVANGLVYFGGYFRGVAGNASRVNVAAVDATTGALAPWNPVPNEGVAALVTDGSVVYMAGGFWVMSPAYWT